MDKGKICRDVLDILEESECRMMVLPNEPTTVHTTTTYKDGTSGSSFTVRNRGLLIYIPGVDQYDLNEERLKIESDGKYVGWEETS